PFATVDVPGGRGITELPGMTMLTKRTLVFIAALVLAQTSTAVAQSYGQTRNTYQRAGSRSVPAPALTNPRNAGQSAQDCNATYSGFRLCDWLRPSPSP
ncbi:MAG: hypothetical protein WAK34_04655, partial [Rhodoplanes sp.]